MKKFLIAVFFVLLGFSFTNQALADAAPAKPAYPNIKLDVRISLGDFADKYVIIRHTSRYGEYYELASDGYVSPNGYGIDEYFAVDKRYFEDNGGIDGLFFVTGSNEDETMSPKDSIRFDEHRYDFVLLKTDAVLDSEFRGKEDNEMVGDAYVKFPFGSDFYIRQGPDDENCATGYSGGKKNCEMGVKVMSYSPREVVGNHIVLVDAEYVNQVSEAPVPSVDLPWYVRFWNFIKSLF